MLKLVWRLTGSRFSWRALGCAIFCFLGGSRTDTPRDIWFKLDDENVKLHDTLDLLYAMSEAARYEELDHKRYANAMDLVWEQLCAIEERYVLLNEALGAATHEQ